MSEPLVSVVMPWLDRSPQMMRRAVASVEAQTYRNYELITRKAVVGRTVGYMRNLCVQGASGDIIAHADEDDWSHPNRLAEQVALLQVSGADCVGYRDMLFWDERPCQGDHLSGGLAVFDGKPLVPPTDLGNHSESWLYTNPIAKYALGTSLMYWRRTWERVPFDDVQKGEDERFCRKVGNVVAVSSMGDEPRMIASVHGGNTSSRIAVGHQQFRRVPEWDEYCRTRMRLGVTK